MRVEMQLMHLGQDVVGNDWTISADVCSQCYGYGLGPGWSTDAEHVGFELTHRYIAEASPMIWLHGVFGAETGS